MLSRDETLEVYGIPPSNTRSLWHPSEREIEIQREYLKHSSKFKEHVLGQSQNMLIPIFSSLGSRVFE